MKKFHIELLHKTKWNKLFCDILYGYSNEIELLLQKPEEIEKYYYYDIFKNLCLT